jgi:hypothetical protein
MQNRLDFPGRRSIRIRLLTLLLGLNVVAVLVTAYLGVNALLAAGERVKQTSSTALRAQAIEYVEHLTLSATS